MRSMLPLYGSPLSNRQQMHRTFQQETIPSLCDINWPTFFDQFDRALLRKRDQRDHLARNDRQHPYSYLYCLYAETSSQACVAQHSTN